MTKQTIKIIILTAILLALGISIGYLASDIHMDAIIIQPLKKENAKIGGLLNEQIEINENLLARQGTLLQELKDAINENTNLEADNERYRIFLESEAENSNKCSSILYSMDSINVKSGTDVRFSGIESNFFSAKFDKAVYLINAADKTSEEIDDYYIRCDSASMRPAFDCDDILIGIRPAQKNLHVGDIIWFDIDKEFDVIHRIVSIRQDSKGSIIYATRGDSNAGVVDEASTKLEDIKFKIIGIIYG